MKKILLTLTAVLCTLATWADAVTVFDASASDWSAQGVVLTSGSKTVGSATWYGGGSASIATGEKTFSDEVKWGARLKLGGASTIQSGKDLARVIKFNCTESGTLKVYAVTGSANADRYVLVSQTLTSTNRDESKAIIKVNTNPECIAVAAVEAGDVYVWADNNIGIYGITFESNASKSVSDFQINGVKINGALVDGSAFDANNTYSAATEYILTPTVAISTTTTYSDKSTSDKDYPVALTINEGKTMYEGTAVVNEVTYTVQVPVKALSTSIADVTASTTWDWTKTGQTEIKLSDTTYPSKLDNIVLGDFIPNTANFNSDALMVTTEYIVRDGKYFQGGYIKFHTTVAGSVKVKFSNTGTRSNEDDRRYLYVNGEKTETGSMDANAIESEAVNVAAGDVELTAKMASSEGNQYLRIYSIVFEEGTPEAISTVGTANSNVMYNLAGQRVNESAKGVVIVGGKKVVK